MVALHRHQLVRLRGEAWHRLQREAADAQAVELLQRWAAGGFPLVVCRQPCGAPQADTLCVGLAAPLAWPRRRWGFTVRRDEVLYFDEFPPAGLVALLLGRAARPGWAALCRSLAALGVCARVYGSHGWQHLTGLQYLRPGSDIDLCLPVDDAMQADEVVRRLEASAGGVPRLDGELIMPDGGAVAWREWQAWRSGRVREVLVKRLHGVALGCPVGEVTA